MRLVSGVEIAVGEAVDHVAEGEEKKEDEDAFPESLCFEGGEVFVDEQRRHGDDGNFSDAKFDAADNEQVAKEMEKFAHQSMLTRRMWRRAACRKALRPCKRAKLSAMRTSPARQE